jgi:branched-chain amino acid transport system ATP-binding protein
MTAERPALLIEGLCVSYGRLAVVLDVDLAVHRGRIATIIGSNGAGKTTIMKAVSGLLTPISGLIQLDGADVAGLPPDEIVARGVSLVPEGRRLFPSLTVRENLMVGAYLRNDRAAIAHDLDRVLGYFPVLAERLESPARDLSGGQQQMLAVGRALMSAPKLLMLDEPSIGLAPVVVEKIAEIITTISQSGVDVLLVEQNAHMALELAQDAYVLELGRIRLQGTGEELMHSDEVREAYLGL